MTCLLTLLALALFAILQLAESQCTIPAPLSNGNQFISTDSGIKLVLTSASGGQIEVAGANYTFFCDGMNSGTSEYYGRMATFGRFLGFCMKLRASSSSTVQGFEWRSNLTKVTGLPTLINAVFPNIFGVSNPVPYAIACNAGGDRPEYEADWVDTSNGALTPGNCPSVLQNNFTFVVNPGSSCSGGIADGISNPNQLNIKTTGCAPLMTYFPWASTWATLTCLHGFSANGMDYVTLRNDTGAMGEVHCMMYSVAGSVMTLSMEPTSCTATQTTTSGSILMVLTSPVAITVSVAVVPGGSGSSTLLPSLLLLALAVLKQLDMQRA